MGLQRDGKHVSPLEFAASIVGLALAPERTTGDGDVKADADPHTAVATLRAGTREIARLAGHADWGTIGGVAPSASFDASGTFAALGTESAIELLQLGAADAKPTVVRSSAGRELGHFAMSAEAQIGDRHLVDGLAWHDGTLVCGPVAMAHGHVASLPWPHAQLTFVTRSPEAAIVLWPPFPDHGRPPPRHLPGARRDEPCCAELPDTPSTFTSTATRPGHAER